jgi:hypothetical protein
MASIKTVSTNVTKIIDYKNGYTCHLEFINDVLKNYRFSKGNINLHYLNDSELMEISNTHWSDHYKIIEKQNKLYFNELMGFNDFEKLY